MHYTYSDVGNVLTIYDDVMSQTQTFTYDQMYRLLSAQASGSGQGLYPTEPYTYDPNTGNLASKSSIAYTYGDPSHAHAVTSLSNGWSYQYDANGNMTQRNVNGQTYNLSYDAEGRMTGVSGAFTGSYAYNGDGQRVVVTEGVTTTVYVGNIFEWNATSQTFVKYYYAGAARIAMREENDPPLFILGDHLGSTSVIANYYGSEHGETGYKAWGETRFITGDMPTDYRFTGQKEHDELGLYFYNARWYDPILGRFVQADNIIPLKEQGVQAWDRFAYVNNNPTWHTDPSGHLALRMEEEGQWTYIIFPSTSNPYWWISAIDDPTWFLQQFNVKFTNGTGTWTPQQKLNVMMAILKVAARLASEGGVSNPAEAFNSVYGLTNDKPMEFVMKKDPNMPEGQYHGYTQQHNLIEITTKTNGGLFPEALVIHELGHAFALAMSDVHKPENIPNPYEITDSLLYKGAKLGAPGLDASLVMNSGPPSEEFANMFVGWVLGFSGEYAWTNAYVMQYYMPIWLDTAIQ